MAETHKTKVAEAKPDGAFLAAYGERAFVASCSCGWKSELRTTVARAKASAVEHQEA